MKESRKDIEATVNSKEYLEWSDDRKYFYERGTYYLSHGEYARPIYKLRKYKDGWGVHKETYYYQGTVRAVQSGRINIINL